MDKAAQVAVKAAIVGIAGTALPTEEIALFGDFPPAGVILFARNVRDREQLASLVASLRAALPENAVLMVDQEGGRVARLRPPHWRAHPPARELGRLFALDPARGLRAAWLTGALIGLDCAAAGLDVVTAPVLDLAIEGANDVIGDRSFGAGGRAVARLGRSVAEGLLAAGAQPVMKHLPGHGRAQVDSHHALPVVTETDELNQDLLPFSLNADLPWAMTAHILYPAWDAERPATLSPVVIESVIRGRVGFQGVLITDDLAMNALSGEPAERAYRAIEAGCDLALYCSGELPPTASVLKSVPPLHSRALSRLAAARGLAARSRTSLQAAELAAEREALC